MKKIILVAFIAAFSLASVRSLEAAPTLKVVSPNGGKKIERGVLTKIEWKYSEQDVFAFRIVLVPQVKDGEIKELLTCTRNFGILNKNYVTSLDIGYDSYGGVIPDGKYKLKIEHCDPQAVGEFLSDMSDRSFKLATPKPKKTFSKSGAPIIKVLSPDGGEKIVDISRVDLSWSVETEKPYYVAVFLIPTENTPFTLTNRTAGIRGYPVGGVGYPYNTSGGVEKSPWSLSPVPNGEYKLRLYIFKYDKAKTDYNPLDAIGMDESDSYFKITSY